MCRTGLHLCSSVLQAMTSHTETQSPDSSVMSNIRPQRHGHNSNSKLNIPIFLSTTCFLFPCVQCFSVKVIVTLSCRAASREGPNQCIFFFYPASSVQCQSHKKASLNTSIMRSTQRLSMTA